LANNNTTSGGQEFEGKSQERARKEIDSQKSISKLGLGQKA